MTTSSIKNPTAERIDRLDADESLRKKLLPFCRLREGQLWEDPLGRHRVGCLDATNVEHVSLLLSERRCQLALNDPPYNIRLGNKSTSALSKQDLVQYMNFSRQWVENAVACLANAAAFYVWLGADYKTGFQPLPDFMIMMREFEALRARNFITMRNQRGYGTHRNWMWVRQELLHYEKNDAVFNVDAEYTDIPKILRGYYKQVNGKNTENLERSKSETIRAGNVWVDIQQVFYRMVENVPGCYAQKPLKSTERIIRASSEPEDVILDLFAHSGTTLIAGEKLNRHVYTADIDPIFAEVSIRRLERYRDSGLDGWQWNSPFPELFE